MNLINTRLILFRVRSLINFLLNSKKSNSIIDPEIRSLINNTFKFSMAVSETREIEEHRSLLLEDKTIISRTDLGAYNSNRKDSFQQVKAIAAGSLSSVTHCRFLFNIARKLPTAKILELGTSFGISTAYLATANLGGQVITLEGDPHIANRANKLFSALKIDNIHLVPGDFNDTLASTLLDFSPFDLVYIDGNHTYNATIKYFEQIAPHLAVSGVIIFDDIRWNSEMHRAWKRIEKSKHKYTTIDLYNKGLVFKGSDKKENLRIIPPLGFILG